MHTCEWCWRRQEDPLTVTVQGDEQSPELCHDCTAYWETGVRKYKDKVALVTTGAPAGYDRETYNDALEQRAEERADPPFFDQDAESDEACDRWERSMDRQWP